MSKRASASKRAAVAPRAPVPPARASQATPVRAPEAPPAPSGDPAAPTFDGQYRVALPSFEGPLDLLLHLIQQHELDILDIPVSFITEKYLSYLQLMRSLSIDLASEYLVMAATLVHIKSKMLLPSVPAGQEDDSILGEEEEDPRAELVRRLLEYQKYKAAAAELGERGTLGRDVFMRGIPEPVPEGPAPFAPMGVFSLLDAFEKVLKRTNVKIDHEVVFDRISITERIVELTERLSERRSMRFEDLVLGPPGSPPLTRFDLVITFLAVLEMAKLKLLKVYQSGPLEPIHLEYAGAGKAEREDPLEEALEAGDGGAPREAAAAESAPKGTNAASPVEEVVPEAVAARPTEEAPSPVEEAPPPAVEDAASPTEIEEAAPSVDEARLEETTPPILEEATLPAEEATPPVEETTPPVEETTSLEDEPTAEPLPPPDEEPPPPAAEATPPPLEEIIAPVLESAPQVDNPDTTEAAPLAEEVASPPEQPIAEEIAPSDEPVPLEEPADTADEAIGEPQPPTPDERDAEETPERADADAERASIPTGRGTDGD